MKRFINPVNEIDCHKGVIELDPYISSHISSNNGINLVLICIYICRQIGYKMLFFMYNYGTLEMGLQAL